MRSRRSLAERVAEAAEAALAAQDYVSAVDVLVGIRWLEPWHLKRWQQGQVHCLDETIQSGPERVAEALRLLGSWATGRQLVPSETDYVARSPKRQALRFSELGNPDVERAYRTHWISGALSERQRERLAERTSRPPELVVVDPHNRKWTCHRCGGGDGDLLMMEDPGPVCLRCAGLDHLEYLPRGDAKLTRRAKAKSARHAVVVRFSRARRRYERQGILVEPQALAEAEGELAADLP